MIGKIVGAALASGAAIAGVAAFRPAIVDHDAAKGDTASATTPAAAGTAMHPDRLIDCQLRRITNFDPNKAQQLSDFTFEGRHSFRLFLPSAPVRTTPPPESTAPAEPVDPRTRVAGDPDGLKAGALPFDRVVDLWPQRVELTAPMSNVAVNLIVVDEVDERAGTASMFLTRANDAVTFDKNHMYSGRCRIATGATAVAQAG